MKAKDIIIQNGGTKFFLGSNLSVRSLLKHLITFTYLGLVLFTLFNIKIDMSNLTSNNFKMIFQSIIIVFFFTRSAITSLSMLNQSFRSFFITTGFILGMVAGSVILMFVRNNQSVTNWSDLTVMGYVYAMVPAYIGIWKLTIALVETKSSPFLSKKMIYNGIASLIYAANILLIMFLLNETYLSKARTNFNLRDNTQMLYILGIIFAFISFSFITHKGWKNYGKKTTKIWHIKSISLSLGIILIIPLSIWMPFKSFKFRPDWEFILYLAFDIFLVFVVFIYSFLKRTEMGSPKIYTILVTMTITLIWANKFLYGYQFGLSVPDDFTLTSALGSTAFILIIQYFKSPNIGKGVAVIYRVFATVLFMLSLALWLALHFERELAMFKRFLDIPELLNALLLIIPTSLAAASILSWAITMSQIKRYSRKKKYILTKRAGKKIERKKMIKEVLNA